MTARGGGRSRGLDEAVRQAGELVGADVMDVVFLVMQKIGREGGVELGQTLVDRGIALGGCAFQRRAIAGEAIIGQLHQALLVGAQGRHFIAFIDGADAGEERGILGDLRGEGRQARGHLGLDGAEFRRRHVGRPDAPIAEDIAERLAGPFHCDDGVLEAGRLGIIGDGIDLGEIERHALFEGRLEVVKAGGIEIRHTAERAGPFREQRV